MIDLVERLRGPVREAASRLIAGSFRRDGERLAEKRPRFSIPARPDEDDDLVLIAALEEAAAALEAEASEGERRGLEQVTADALALSCDDQFALATNLASNIGYELTEEPLHPDTPKPGAFEAMVERALIPEAPVRDVWQPIDVTSAMIEDGILALNMIGVAIPDTWTQADHVTYIWQAMDHARKPPPPRQ